MRVSTSEQVSSTAKWAGVGMLILFVFGVLVMQVGATAIAGQRVSGTSDVAALNVYYNHQSLMPIYWQGGLGLLGFALFVAAFRRYLQLQTESGLMRLLIDAASIIGVIEVSVLLVVVSLQAAMVQIAAAGPQNSSALLAVFAAWDWTYNGLLYWTEVGWLSLFSVVGWRTGAFPRLLAAFGLIVSAFHLFHTTVLMLGLPDAVTIPGTILFVVWFIWMIVYLLRGGTARKPALASATIAPTT
ncbi:MAG TPA: hypothetical protein VJ085_07995 [Candidatus Acidoferrales bacterium]|nr:hypothetical protein [Candidatus Acidoferrales bacterium]